MQVGLTELSSIVSKVLEAEQLVSTLPNSKNVLDDTLNELKDMLHDVYKEENKRRNNKSRRGEYIKPLPIDRRLKKR